MKNIKRLLCRDLFIAIKAVIFIRYNYGVMLLTFSVFFISCQFDSRAQENNSKIYLDSLPMTYLSAIGKNGHEVYCYNSYQNQQGVLIKKLKINRKDRSAKVVDSLKIGNAYLRYIGADEQNHIYISCLPVQKEHLLLIQNKEYQFGSADSGLKLVYILDANNFNVVDSIIYTGNEMQLTKGDLPGGIITTTSHGVCLLNRLSYSPRFNKLDNRKLEGNALYFLFYKSVNGSVLLPISKDLLNDFNDLPDRMKHYVNQVGGFKTSDIYIIGDDIHRIYFTLNLSVTVENKDSIQEKNGGGASFLSAFFN